MNTNELFQVKIPSSLRSDTAMSDFLETLCTSCQTCPNLITIEPGPDQCEKCASQSLKRAIKTEPQSPPPAAQKKKPNVEPVAASSTTNNINEAQLPTSSTSSSPPTPPGKLLNVISMKVDPNREFSSLFCRSISNCNGHNNNDHTNYKKSQSSTSHTGTNY